MSWSELMTLTGYSRVYAGEGEGGRGRGTIIGRGEAYPDCRF